MAVSKKRERTVTRGVQIPVWYHPTQEKNSLWGYIFVGQGLFEVITSKPRANVALHRARIQDSGVAGDHEGTDMWTMDRPSADTGHSALPTATALDAAHLVASPKLDDTMTTHQ